MSKFIVKCLICHEPESDDDAVIVCSTCNIKVHPRCYLLGLPELPTEWQCELCRNGLQPNNTICELCNKIIKNKTVVMKETFNPKGKYVHFACGIDSNTYDNITYGCVYKHSESDQLHSFDTTSATKINKQNKHKREDNNNDIDNSSDDNVVTTKQQQNNNNKKPKTIHTTTTATTSLSRSSIKSKPYTPSKNKFVDYDSETEQQKHINKSNVKKQLDSQRKKKQQDDNKKIQQKEHKRFLTELRRFEEAEYLDRRTLLSKKTVDDINRYDDYDATYYDTSAPCEICGLRYIRDDSAADCDFVICGSDNPRAKQGCDCTVHNYCNLGPFPIPEDDWYCNACNADIPAEDLICAICEKGGKPNNVSAFKRININYKQYKSLRLKSEWAHTVCGLFVRGCYIDPDNKSQPINGIQDINDHDKRNLCSICNSRCGATLMCAAPECRVTFHASCALYNGYQFENLTIDESKSNDDNRVAFCPKHNISDKVERRVRNELNLPLPKCLIEKDKLLAKNIRKSTSNKSTPQYISPNEIQQQRAKYNVSTSNDSDDDIVASSNNNTSQAIIEDADDIIDISDSDNNDADNDDIINDSEPQTETAEGKRNVIAEIQQATKAMKEGKTILQDTNNKTTVDNNKTTRTTESAAVEPVKTATTTTSTTTTTTNKAQSNSNGNHKAKQPTSSGNGNTIDETARDKFVSTILKALGSSEFKVIASQIEKQLYKNYNNVSEYKAKLRAVIYTLNNNKSLAQQLLDGEMSANELIKLTYQQTADDSIKLQRLQEQEEAIHDRYIEAIKPRKKYYDNDVNVEEQHSDNNDNDDIVTTDDQHNDNDMPSLEKTSDDDDIQTYRTDA